VADRHGLRLIYDAAHAFGVRLDTGSLMAAGDAAILSFHATKVFHTFEGGAIVCRDEALKARIDLLRNFGFKGETRVLATGINAKMNELQAAFGCLTLGSIDGRSPPAPDCRPLRRRLCPPARPAPAGPCPA
jgi:dTDP-4-amino-4,6-dideoxygalactose transaminase